MEYRGSKSLVVPLNRNINVKEQRVDGSYINKLILRYTLTGCESSYLIRVPSKQSYRNIRDFHSACFVNTDQLSNTQRAISPFYFTGFVDGEGCFLIAIRKNNNSSVD